MNFRTVQVRDRNDGRSQRGAALVEFAFIFPLLFLLLMGIVDFGVVLSNQIALRQGARESVRQGSVANFAASSSCGATFTVQGSENMRKLICLTKDRSDLTATETRVAVRFDPPATGYPAGGETGPVGNSLVVCSVAPIRSISGIFNPVLDGKYLRTKTVMRIEQGSGVAESQANEADPTGEDWAWCTA